MPSSERRWPDAPARRALDVLLAGAALLLGAPLLLGIALWIRLDSPGPALFRQERVGRFGVPFRIHKFRTMRHVADLADPVDPAGPRAAAGAQITVGADPRITRAGRWLRRSRLDELPQLIDVLRGRMSLVGPRPEVPRYVALYPAELRAKLLSVRPGITDAASLASLDESDRLALAADPEREYVEVVMPAKLALAARSVDRMSLGNDLRLIGLTLRMLLSRRNG